MLERRQPGSPHRVQQPSASGWRGMSPISSADHRAAVLTGKRLPGASRSPTTSRTWPSRTRRSRGRRPRRRSSGRSRHRRRTGRGCAACPGCSRRPTRSWPSAAASSAVTSLWWSTQSSSASGSGSIVSRPLLAQVAQAVGDPVDVLLDGHRHVAQHRRALRPGDHEQVREAVRGDAEVGARALGPLLLQGEPVPSADAELEQGAGHRVEAGGEDDDVHLVLRVRRSAPRSG